MNWFNKIKELTRKVDKSPELKRGEIKLILIKTASDVLPDFGFLAYKNGCYTFQRIRKTGGLTVYELLHIIFALKDKNFACSIASIINQDYIYSNQYNNGMINPHIDLKVLRNNSGVLDINEAYYFHNGQVETTTKIVSEIFLDFKKYGLPFLDKQFEQLKNNDIVQRGFEYINNLQIDRQKLESEITQELKIGGYLLSNLKHPIYTDLKEKLLSINGQNTKDRQKIQLTANELLEIYWMKK